MATLVMVMYKTVPIKLKFVWGGLPLLLHYKIENEYTLMLTTMCFQFSMLKFYHPYGCHLKG
jgi:hypothetical protein